MGSNQSGEGSRDKAPAPQTNTTARSLEPLDAEEQAAWLQTSAQSLQRNGEPRTVTLSRTLTQLCEACGGLLEIQDDEDAFQMHEAPISELNKQSKAHSTSAQAEAVQLPGVPAHITAEAIQLLEKWASLPQRQPRPGADALAEWLYRATRSGAGWNALLCAADFLGCNEFLNVATDASLLFLRSMGKISLQKLLTRQQPPHAVQFGDHVSCHRFSAKFESGAIKMCPRCVRVYLC